MRRKRVSNLQETEYTAAVHNRKPAVPTEEILIPEEAVRDLARVDLTGRPYHVVKRIIDVAASVLGLAVLVLPFVLISAAIWLDNPGNILLAQYRVGRDGRLFRLYKFRTMHKDAPRNIPTAQLQDSHLHITRVGRFLRSTSLDELPQLFNVLRGDMSLVGPRPLIAEEEEIHRMRLRFGVYQLRPGITGLAQINGRDTVSPADKVRWDVKYLQRYGLLTDLRILAGTLPKIVDGEDIREGCAGQDNLKEK